ncbi:uncharacterized protein LOC109857173 isoform X1 [Pseudomyrmex gracilis]|uniref:uncharacterized protein LOC109857173 isoform X1 n=1 Tax=Pseudomyrmex gracilis TaxID=219809 RepID=UPI0009957533|nr:uncharacterized protein LOC109857173 isoform X1 [Pseudomyrmex gracilis]
MLINYFRHCLLFGVFVPCFGDLMNLTTYTNESLARREREVGTKYLIFPQGSNVQLVYCLTVGTYAKPQGIFTVGVTAGLAWELPHRNTVPYRKPAEVYHRRSRRELYRKVELMLKTQAKNGKACVLKAICKAARRERENVGKGTFVEEILHAVFSLPGGRFDIDPMTEYERTYHLGENCDEVQAKCPDVF